MEDYKIEPGVTEYGAFQFLKARDIKAPSPQDATLANRPMTAEEIAKAKALVRYVGPA